MDEPNTSKRVPKISEADRLGDSVKTQPKKAKASLPTGDTLTSLSEERVPKKVAVTFLADNSVTASSLAAPSRGAVVHTEQEDTLLSDEPTNDGVELVLTDSEVEEESAKDELSKFRNRHMPSLIQFQRSSSRMGGVPGPV